jgi:hypothetical protein
VVENLRVFRHVGLFHFGWYATVRVHEERPEGKLRFNPLAANESGNRKVSGIVRVQTFPDDNLE